MRPRQTLPVGKRGCPLLVAVLVLCCSRAWAVGGAAAVDLNRFHPAPGDANAKILTVDLADVGPHLQLVPQLFLHYANLPLLYTLGGHPQADVVKNRVTTDLSVALALWRRLQVAVALPITLYQAGDALNPADFTNLQDPYNPGKPLTPPPRPVTAGIEDLRLSAKGVLWRDPDQRFGVGAAGDLALPTGDADGYLGSRLPTFTLRLLGHLRYRRLTAALNVGWLFASTEQVLTVRTGMGLVFAAGAQVQVYQYRNVPFFLLAEYTGLAHSRFGSLQETPMELLLSAKAQYRQWTFFLGAGPGLTRGYGEPDVRVFAGATWAWQYVPPPPPPTPPAPVPQQPPPPPVQPTCEGEDCPTDQNRPIKVEVKGPKLELSERVFFDFDKDTIKPISYPLLDEVVKVLKARPDLGKIRIEGHTDGIGSDAYNLDLSRRRSRSVVLYLIEHGIESARLSYEGYGKRCPIVPNDTPDNRARNRRVDFIIDDRPPVPPTQCPAARP